MAETFFGITDAGRYRQNNEDTFIAEPVMKEAFIAACVIDGVGGYEGGEIAAALARESILTYFSVPSGSIQTMMQEALVAANEKIIAEKTTQRGRERMACVVTLALVEKGKNKFYYAHVGDTRLYLFRDGSLVKVTKDHSFVGFLEDSGRLDEDGAMNHPKRNEIDRALGFEASIAPPSDYIETGESPFLPGDILLLCSDGLTDMLTKSAITSLLHSNGSLEHKAKSLVQAANEAGGKDNVTVVLVQNEQPPSLHQPVKPTGMKGEWSVPMTAGMEPVKTGASPDRSRKRRGRKLLLAFLFLFILGGGALFWQWLQKEKVPNEIGSYPSIASVADTGVQSFQQLLDSARGVLQLANLPAGDTVWVPLSIQIGQDSIHIKGSGKTVIAATDSDTSLTGVITVLSNVRYVLFDSLVLRNLVIHVGNSNRSAVHFRDVRFQHSGVMMDTPVGFTDSLVTGQVVRGRLVPMDSLNNKVK